MENITQEKFNAYVAVQESGATNMFDVRRVIELADEELTKEDCLAIMKNYSALKLKYF